MKSHLLLFATTVCYAFIGVFVKMIGDGIHPIVITFFRVLIALILLAIVIPFFDRNSLGNLKSDPWRFLLLGLIATVNFATFTTAFTFAPITNVVLFSSSYAIWAVIFAWMFMRETATKQELGAIGAGMIGIIILNPLQSASFIGNMLALACGLFYGLYLALLRKELKNHSLSTALWTLAFSSIFLLPAPFIFGAGDFMGNLKWLILLGVLCTGMAQLMLSMGLRNVKTDVASIIILSGLPLATFFGWGFFGEEIGLRIIVGGGIIVASVIYLEVISERGSKTVPHLHK